MRARTHPKPRLPPLPRLPRLARIRAALGLLAVALVLGACVPDPPATGEDTEGDGDAANVHDPLSMPAEPTLDPASFNAADNCAPCHPTYYEEWALSRHARSMVDPIFQALVGARQLHLEATEDQFCLQCHSAICVRGGECVSGFAFDELSPIALEGITCESCHKVASIERPFNSGHVLEPDGPIRGPNVDPKSNSYHESEYSPVFEESAFCGACHDVVETNALELERPYQEWLESPANPGTSCQDCHMPTYTGAAAPGAKERELHRHRWIGVDLPTEDDITDPEILAEIDAEIEALLASAASLSLEVAPSVSADSQLDLTVTIQNLISGHALPTGSTFLRQVWLELRVTDADDNLLYQTGHLDEMGDLRNHWSTVAPYSDPDLIVLGSGFINRDGAPELFPWYAEEHSSTAISPLHQRTYTLFVPIPAGTNGPAQIEAILHFRSFPPFLLRMLGLEELIERMVVRDIASASAQVEVSG